MLIKQKLIQIIEKEEDRSKHQSKWSIENVKALSNTLYPKRGRIRTIWHYHYVKTLLNNSIYKIL